MTDMHDFNQQVIDEFRANDGIVGGPFAGFMMVLLHHAGAKSGTKRIAPLAARMEGDDVVIFASKGGAPTNPDWFHNIVANPDTTIEIGADTSSVRARVAEGDERSRFWEAQKVDSPQFAEYEAKTDRVIPVIILEPR